MTDIEEQRRRFIEKMRRDMTNMLPHRPSPSDAIDTMIENAIKGGGGYIRISAYDPYNKPRWRARLCNAWSALKGELE